MLIDRHRVLSRLVGGAVGICLAVTVGVAGGFAQDAESTPTAEATPAAEEQPPAPEFDASAADMTRLTEQIQRVSDTIALVQGDRDAVGDSIEPQTVDALLAHAVTLRDEAQAALDGDDASGAPAKLIAAHATVMAASELIRAQLADFGLPSQQAAASRVLVNAYYQVREATEAAQDEGAAEDSAFYVATAQELYRQAYELYNAGAYEGAGKTARVAAQVSQIGAMRSGVFKIQEARAGAAPGSETIVIEGPHAEGNRFEVILPPEGVVEGRHDAVSGRVHGDGLSLPGIAGPAIVERAVPGDSFFSGSDLMAGDFSNQTPLEAPEPEF